MPARATNAGIVVTTRIGRQKDRESEREIERETERDPQAQKPTFPWKLQAEPVFERVQKLDLAGLGGLASKEV